MIDGLELELQNISREKKVTSQERLARNGGWATGGMLSPPSAS
jgi:hypothetical protein